MLFFSHLFLTLLAAALSLSGVQGAAIERRATTPGCGKSQDWAGQTRSFTINSSGGQRTYRVHLPSNYNANSGTGLVVAYHGSGGTAEGMESLTRFSDSSVNPNWIAVYPQGVNGNWQGPTYATDGVSDKVFTTDLINRLKNDYCVDDSRVYAVGQSNGGGFGNTLACSPGHGGQFAAVALSSVALYTDVTGDDTCTPARSPIPLIEIHGASDGTIPYDGGSGRGGPLPNVGEWVSRWARRNQCGSPSYTNSDGVERSVYNCAGVSNALEHYKVAGAGHEYQGAGGKVHASRVFIEFLARHSKP